MDIALILNVFLTIEAVIAFIFNLYVLVSVILTKQVRILFEYKTMLVSNNLFRRNISLLKEMHGESTKIVKRIIIILLGKPWKHFYILMRSLKSKIATNFLLLNLSSCLQISRPTNFLLLHISGLFTIITLLFIIFSAPSLFSKSNNAIFESFYRQLLESGKNWAWQYPEGCHAPLTKKTQFLLEL